MKRLIVFLCLILAAEARADIERRIFIIPPPPKKCSGYDLFEAVQRKDFSCLKESARHMDMNEVDAEGETPLHLAIRAQNGQAILFLLRHGADLNKINFQNQTPKQLAEQHGLRPLVDFFNKVERETERLATAVEFNDARRVKESVRRGVALGSRDVRLDTFLHRAAQSGFVEIGKILIEAGAGLEARNYLGETPLHSAALRDDIEFMSMLLEKGANPNAINERRQTILDIAEIHGNPSILHMLARFNARHGHSASVPLEISGGDDK